MTSLPKIAVALLAIVGLAAVGCAGRGEATGAEASTEEEREEAILAFTECMREQGVDLPDPTSANGGRGLRIARPERVTDADREKMDKAREACDKHLEGAFQELTPEQESEMQDNMLAFARCMRENGIDMPDPDFSDSAGPGKGGFVQRLGVDPDDPDFQKADEKCRDEVFGADGAKGGPRLFIGGPGRRSG